MMSASRGYAPWFMHFLEDENQMLEISHADILSVKMHVVRIAGLQKVLVISWKS